jgi:RNA polymerase sigma factor (sigma-70 family)
MLRSSPSLLDVFVTHRASLRRVAQGILGSPDHADDLLQDACLKLVAADADGVLDPLAYAFRMVRNMAFDACRRATLESRLFDDEDAGAAVEAPGGSPERVAIDRQQLQLVMRVLAELPERTRRVVEWCRLDGRSQREIAERLQLSPTMVHFLLRDATERCRAAVG